MKTVPGSTKFQLSEFWIMDVLQEFPIDLEESCTSQESLQKHFIKEYSPR